MTKGFDGVKNNISKTFKIIFCYLWGNRWNRNRKNGRKALKRVKEIEEY